MILLIFFLLVLAIPAQARTFWVANNGSNGNACTDTTTPQTTGAKQTIVAGLACLAAGDTLYIRAGSYNEHIDNTTSNIPGGSSWATATVISGYTGETVEIKPSSSPGILTLSHQSKLSGQRNEWIIWQDLILDGTNVIGGGYNIVYAQQNHNRFSRVTLRNLGAGGSDVNVSAAMSIGGVAGDPVIGVEFSRGSVHDNSLISNVDNGNNAPYGFYDSRSTGTIVEYSDIYRNGGYGIHGYSGAGDHQSAIYRYNRMWDNQMYGINGESTHILASSGNNHQVYGNVLWSNGNAVGPQSDKLNGITIGSGTGDYVANNTIYNMPRSGIQMTPTASSFTIINNIIVNSNQNGASFSNLDDQGASSITYTANLCYGTGGTTNCTITGQDPKFVSTSIPDFHLQSGSPASDAGANLGAAYSPDAAGVARPTSGAWEIGAYESVGGPSPVVTITQPASCTGTSTACTVTSATVTVAGTTSVSSGTVSGDTWICNRCTTTSGAAFGVPTSWILPTLTLNVGVNIITVTGTGSLGGMGADTITITYAPTFPGNSLAAAFAFDEGSGGTLTDATSNGNTGTLINTPTWVSGRYGGALQFNGVNQYVRVLDSNTLDVTQSFTLSLWAQPTATSNAYTSLIEKNSSGNPPPYRLYASVLGECGTGGVAGFVASNGASGPQDTACTATPLQPNLWTHLALTYDGANLKLYRQGALIVTTPHTGYIEPSTGILQIAASEFGEYFHGIIDEVRIYNFALPLTGGANTVFGAGCNATDAANVKTASIIGDANCPIIPLAPPITFKVGASTTLKLGASSTMKIGSVPQ